MIIFLLIITFNVVNRMVFGGRNTHSDLLYQKSHYLHHQRHYMTSLLEGFILSGFRIKRRPAFTPVSKLKENGI